MNSYKLCSNQICLLKGAQAAAAAAAQGASSGTTAPAQSANQEEAAVMTAEERAVLSDKPSLQQSLKNSSEFRQAKIHEKEDEIVDKEKKTRMDMENDARDKEQNKNRTRLIEIMHGYETTAQFIQNLVQEESQR
ncbi:MAG: hypothetical protein EZS28_020008 [Streblomastix strix]|uniref:Uncharacterized protein n=1 Tax=Streblomastix strix TaxID=222440 RepID=A0A5J4VPA5_9EUKA|nr:MAG: hypothetical protein EZS28_020008 [Streblomastix strix]